MPTFANARAYLEEVIRRYRELTSYSDTGKSHMPHGRRQGLCLFTTDYRAPADFRFAFDRPHPHRRLKHRIARSIVGVSASEPYFFSRSYNGEQKVDHPESLDMTVAGATGISSGTVHTIARLLFSEVGGFNMLDLRRLRFRANRMVDGVRCVAVTGLHPRGGRYTAWFGSDDFLLRRIVCARFQTEELRTNILVNQALTDEHFAIPRVEA
jgi:hypothetical protein